MNSSFDPHRLLMVDLSGPTLSADERAFFADYKVGGICLFSRSFSDPVQTAELTTDLRELLGPDLLIATDQEGGGVVRALSVPYSPGTMLLGAADDANLTRDVAAETARGLRALGVNVNFAPVADVNNNPRNPVIGERSFGSDPAHVAKHVAAYVQGLQSEGVAATVKHFPGHGDTATDSHLDLPTLEVPLERIQNVELVPFRAAFAAGAACAMSYHGRITALDADSPATLSRKVMTDVLREELGFDGVSFTDALEMNAIAARFSPAEAVVRALGAGIDMPLYDVHTGPLSVYEDIFRSVGVALGEGRLDEQEMVAKRQRLRRLARRYPARPAPATAWREGDAARLAEAARRGIVTLGDLPPLDRNTQVALVAAKDDVGGAASDQMASPVEGLATRLEARGFALTRVLYNREQPDLSRSDVETAAAQHSLTLFVSTSRTRMEPEEVSLGRDAAQHARQFVHLALWNPYHVADLPGPALISFGFREASLEAVVDVLTQEAEARGHLPIPLDVASS